MHDWQQLVHHRLSRLQLDAAEKEEVCAELAAHLEENYQSLLRDGLSDEDATWRVLNDVANWRHLKRNIERSRKKEFTMTKRVSQFWFPALSTLLLSTVLLAFIQAVGPNPWVSPNIGWGTSHGLRMGPVAVAYFSWLLFLPLIGGLGAFLSIRAGGSLRMALSSVIFPVLPYLAFFVIALPLSIILDDYVAHNITIPAFFVGLCTWVIFPAAALSAGGWPVRHFAARWLVSRSVAHS
jgi:hypothetical protein